jgi:orotidine-5'-phosphate decarboxylase
MTPQAAISAGATYIVVGRPIRDRLRSGGRGQEYLRGIAEGLAA